MTFERVALDTSLIVAALLTWHERHGPALRALKRTLTGASVLIVPAPALIEAYAVLTRLPPPHRLAPASAGSLLVRNFHDRAYVSPVEGQRLPSGSR